MENEQQKLAVVFIPSLAAILKNAEDDKGSALTENEVLEIRDKAVCMTVPAEAVLTLNESRGYEDINPENCWNEWCELRTKF